MELTPEQIAELLSFQLEGESWNAFARRAGTEPKTLAAWVHGQRQVGVKPKKYHAVLTRLRQDRIRRDTASHAVAQKFTAATGNRAGSAVASHPVTDPLLNAEQALERVQEAVAMVGPGGKRKIAIVAMLSDVNEDAALDWIFDQIRAEGWRRLHRRSAKARGSPELAARHK